jgi:hypothetical protein
LLHHRGPGEQLRDRGDAEQGPVWINLAPRLEVRVPVPLAENKLVPDHDGDDAAGDVL